MLYVSKPQTVDVYLMDGQFDGVAIRLKEKPPAWVINLFNSHIVQAHKPDIGEGAAIKVLKDNNFLFFKLPVYISQNIYNIHDIVFWPVDVFDYFMQKESETITR